MTIDPNRIIPVPLTMYEIIVAKNQLRSSIPEAGNQQTIVNIIMKLDQAMNDASK